MEPDALLAMPKEFWGVRTATLEFLRWQSKPIFSDLARKAKMLTLDNDSNNSPIHSPIVPEFLILETFSHFLSNNFG